MTMAKALTVTAADVRPVAEARLLGSIDVGRGPIVDIAASGATIVAANSCDSSVTVVNAHSMTPEAVIPVAGEPSAVALAGNRVFAAAAAPTYDSVAAIDAGAQAFLAALPLELQIAGVVARRDGRTLFVAGDADGAPALAIVDVASGRVDTIDIPAGAGGVVNAVRISPNGRLVVVAISDMESGSLVVIDPAKRRVMTSVLATSSIRDVVLRGNVAHVLGCDREYGGIVETIDMKSRRSLSTAWIGGTPTQFALSADGAYMYVVYHDAIAVLSMITNEITGTIEVDAQPSCITVNPNGSRLFIADYAGSITAYALTPGPTINRYFDVEAVAVAGARELVSAGV
jgi:DNA-binding beta-propeller fold protein YncE